MVALPATAVADQIGSAKAANMVVLGALIGITNLIDQSSVARVLEEMTKNRSLVELNLKAFEAGLSFASQADGDDCLWGV